MTVNYNKRKGEQFVHDWPLHHRDKHLSSNGVETLSKVNHRI